MSGEPPTTRPGDVEVVIKTMGEGWITIYPVLPTEFQRLVEYERLPSLMNHALVTWLQMHPTARVRATLAIDEDGYTTILHVWYDGPP